MILIVVLFSTAILPVSGDPIIKDHDVVVQKFVSDIPNSPTAMTFVGNDILVLQKTDGQVHLIKDGVLQEKPVLDVHVTNRGEQGMLGITNMDSIVYLYFTESTKDGGTSLGNHIYRYDWNGQELVNPVLVKELPGFQYFHNGGAMVTGLDGTVYAVIGDQGTYGVLQNHPSGGIDNTSVILRVAPEGPYYAMGIRNSFGLAVDPVTGNLWDTENGDDDFDEINLVSPNFNSGWDVIMGPATESEIKSLPDYDGYEYSDPEFSWQKPVAPTALTFVDSESLGKYKNNVFVADCIYGNLYKFELNLNRTGFVFKNPELSDTVINTDESIEEILFGSGFGCITDIKIGPDGFLYVLSLSDGTIYRILPKSMTSNQELENSNPIIQYVLYAVIASIIIGMIVMVKSRKKVK